MIGDLYRHKLSQDFAHSLGQRFAQIGAVVQQTLSLLQPMFATTQPPAKPPYGLPPSRNSLQMEKYECAVRYLGNSSGSMRHWQPLLSKYRARTEYFGQVYASGVGLPARTLQQRLDNFKSFATDVARIIFSHAPTLLSAVLQDHKQVLTTNACAGNKSACQ